MAYNSDIVRRTLDSLQQTIIVKTDAAEPEKAVLFHVSSMSKPGAYITHRAAQLASFGCVMLIEANFKELVSNRDEEWAALVWRACIF